MVSAVWEGIFDNRTPEVQWIPHGAYLTFGKFFVPNEHPELGVPVSQHTPEHRTTRENLVPVSKRTPEHIATHEL